MRKICLPLMMVMVMVMEPASADARGRSRRSRSGSDQRSIRGSWNATTLRGSSYLSSFRAARRVLQRQPGLVRLKQDLPTILIPDLHGRRDYLDAVLAARDPATGRSYMQLLRDRQVQVVCLGDVMHTEVRRRLWRTRSHGNGSAMPAAAMEQEMAESLGTLKRIADLKAAHPEHFHLLRGNHDDVGPATGRTHRLPRQIKLTREYLQEKFGRPMVRELSGLFSALPSAATGRGFVASHANPMFPVTRQEVEQGSERAVASLTRARVPSFTQLRRQSRRQARDSQGTLREVIRALGDDPGHDLYIHGHLWARPMRIRGQQVYFGNPADSTFLRLDPRRQLRPERSLFDATTGARVSVRRR
jgi:hypothetical protein